MNEVEFLNFTKTHFSHKHIDIKSIEDDLRKFLKLANIEFKSIVLGSPSKPDLNLYEFVEDIYRNIYFNKINSDLKLDDNNNEKVSKVNDMLSAIERITKNSTKKYVGLLCDYNMERFKALLNKAKKKDENFDLYCKLLESGIGYISFNRGNCVLTELPSRLHDSVALNQSTLNDPEDAVLRIMDKSYHYVQGLNIKSEIFNKIKNKDIKIEEILTMENTDQRSAYLLVYDMEYLLKELNAEVVDVWQPQKPKSEFISDKVWALLDYGEVTLYRVAKEKIKTREDGLFVKYKDPSTARVYIDGVPESTSIHKDRFAKDYKDREEDIEIKTAHDAMLWKSDLSRKEFDEMLVVET